MMGEESVLFSAYMRLKAREIIGEAWEFTQHNKRLIIWYAFFPALLTTLVGIVYLGYQYLFLLNSPAFGADEGFLLKFISSVLDLIRANISSTVPLFIATGIIVILYILIPSLCEGAIIQLIARKRNDQEVRTRDGFRYGIMSFLPIFEYSWLVRTFSIFSVLTLSTMIIRGLGWEGFQTLSPILIVFALAGIILTLLFTYTEFFIVIDDRRVIESVAKSSVLVMTHLEETILLSILMLIISIRILIQIVFVLLIPAAMITIAYFLTSSTIPGLALGLAAVVGLILLYIAAYLSATIHVFAASVWTFTFLDLTAQKDESARKRVKTTE